MEGDKEAESSTPQSSGVSSMVMVDNKKKVEGPGEASRTQYLERVKDLDLQDLACKQGFGLQARFDLQGLGAQESVTRRLE